MLYPNSTALRYISNPDWHCPECGQPHLETESQCCLCKYIRKTTDLKVNKTKTKAPESELAMDEYKVKPSDESMVKPWYKKLFTKEQC